jgi:cation/acetate symporter
MAIDPYILAFSAITVFVTIWMGFRSARTSKTASDFFVAGRSVSVGWNASAISGEYLSAASFMGVAGMVMSSGYDALWYPVCYACGYLFLLLFIAGPLRRFGAYTIPDFAEGRFDSPVFRKIAVVFVLFIGFFYTMPQMKGAGTTLAYIFPGLPYWAGVVLVGAVITLNVALGGMKGITLVQAFQYWAKMFAISVPVFVLMAVYGHYGKQVGVNGANDPRNASRPSAHRLISHPTNRIDLFHVIDYGEGWANNAAGISGRLQSASKLLASEKTHYGNTLAKPLTIVQWYMVELRKDRKILRDLKLKVYLAKELAESTNETIWNLGSREMTPKEAVQSIGNALGAGGILMVDVSSEIVAAVPARDLAKYGVVSGDGSAIARVSLPGKAPKDDTWLNPFGPLTTKASKAAKLSPQESKPYSLLYTYSLIIALVCGTAGLPHILVRFYTNPDGVAAKRTTMWVMILIGVFYVFPPVFGVMGRNLLPELYEGVGAKGTDKIVLELPRILNEKFGVLGSVLSGITCAGAFAAFMSTFSGLLVSMTGAVAHDVYGRMLNPKATPRERMRMFKWSAVMVGGIAILLGSRVEKLEINFMVGQAFAIAAASYFPLLFMSVWWRKLTMKGAATGMLSGGLLALAGISLTSFTTLGWLKWDSFWAAHPLLRILCEQPAIWAVPLAITLMIIVSKLTQKEVPADIRMKMLVLHAPEKLGLKQEYIQDHQPGH